MFLANQLNILGKALCLVINSAVELGFNKWLHWFSLSNANLEMC